MLKTFTAWTTLCTLALLVGCADSGSSTSQTSTETPVLETQTVAYTPGQQVVIHVPDMHCPFACYPKVKQTLEQQPGVDVESVTLVEQKDEALIDDPRIIVTLKENFDSTQTVNAIAEAGFSGATIAAHSAE